MEACLYPRRVVNRLISDPWLVLRIGVCVGVFVGFAFWDQLNLRQVEDSKSIISDDKLLGATDWLYKIFVENPTRVPVISAHVLMFVYLFIFAQLAIYVQTGDFIFPSVLISWMLALFITWLTPLPLSPDAIRYDQGTWFVLERFVTDTTVSWHLMMLILAIYSVIRAYPYYPTYLLSILVFVLTLVYLAATRNIYAVSFLFACLCAGAGIAGQIVLRNKYEEYITRRNYEQMKDGEDTDENSTMVSKRERELASALADEFTVSRDNPNAASDPEVVELHRLELRPSDGEIELDGDDDNDNAVERKEEEEEHIVLP